MGRDAKPWKRKQTGTWYVEIAGQQVNLGKDREEAFDKFHEMMANRHELTPKVAVVHLLDQFLDWVERRKSPRTYEWYQRYLQPFAKHVGKNLKVIELKPHHVTSWIDKDHSDSKPNTVHGAIRAVQRAFNWAVKEGHIGKNPVAGVEKPTPTRREVVVTDEQYAQILARVTDQEEKDLLVFLWETGARVQEVREIEAKHFEEAERRIVFPPSESKGKKMSRVIYLNDTAFEIVQRLAGKWTKGAIFRNSRGVEWNKNSIRCRFRKYEMEGLCGTALRHTWITRALMSGVDPLTVSVLAGHRNLHMVANQYSHLAKKPDFLREQLDKVKEKEPASSYQVSSS